MLSWVIWWSFGKVDSAIVDVTHHVPINTARYANLEVAKNRLPQNFAKIWYIRKSLVVLLQAHVSSNVWQKLCRKSLQSLVSNDLNVFPQFFKCIWLLLRQMICAQSEGNNNNNNNSIFIYTRFAINIYKVLNWTRKSARTPDVVKTNRIWSSIYSTLKMY